MKIKIEEKCQKGYKTHEKRKTKKMFGKQYRNCVKAEGVVAMLKQHALSDWGIEEVQEKVTKAHAPPKEATVWYIDVRDERKYLVSSEVMGTK